MNKRWLPWSKFALLSLYFSCGCDEKTKSRSSRVRLLGCRPQLSTFRLGVLLGKSFKCSVPQFNVLQNGDSHSTYSIWMPWAPTFLPLCLCLCYLSYLQCCWHHLCLVKPICSSRPNLNTPPCSLPRFPLLGVSSPVNNHDLLSKDHSPTLPQVMGISVHAPLSSIELELLRAGSQ